MKFDLIIIGAGPSGLSLACALAKTKLKIAIIEKNSKSKFAKPKTDGRDIALTHRSKSILKKFGIWKFINSKSISPIKEARILDGNSSNYLHFDHTKTVEDSLGYLVPNQIIRKAIYKKLQTLKTTKIFSQNIRLIKLKCRIDTNKELDYFKAGGILQYVLNSIVSKAS